MVEGRLIALGKEPCNVQVVLGATPSDAFHLQDVEGVFLTGEEEEHAPCEDGSISVGGL